MSFTMTY
jgi:hypothetical protein